MRKQTTYSLTKFSPEVLLRAATSLDPDKKGSFDNSTLSCNIANVKWDYDSADEFFADYRKHIFSAFFWINSRNRKITLTFWNNDTIIAVHAESRSVIESIFNIFEELKDASRILPPKSLVPAVSIFIGHGRNGIWKELKDHLQEKHNFTVQAYETGARAGHGIRDILEDLVASNTFAILVLTAEDDQATGSVRARQNVVHEAGLFQGRLGFSKAIMLVEQGVEMFSNVDGVQHIPFEKDRIRETFGDVVATIRREFP